MNNVPARSTLKIDLFAHGARLAKFDALDGPLQFMPRHIVFKPLVKTIDELLPRGDGRKGGRPPYPTAVMMRVLVVKYLNQHSDEQMEFLLLDHISYQRFCLLADSANVPDRSAHWHWQQRLGGDGITALFQAVDNPLLKHGHVARCGQVIDASLGSLRPSITSPKRRRSDSMRARS